MKICSQCKIKKSNNKFYEDKKHLDRLRSACIKCHIKYVKKYQQSNKEKIKRYKLNNKEKIRKHKQEYRQRNKKRFNKYNKKWYKNNREKALRQAKKYYQKNRDKKLRYRKNYYQKNKEKINGYTKRYCQNRRKIDLRFQLNSIIGNSVYAALKSNKNGHCWESLVNFTLQDLIQHLEKKFTPEMSWQNYGSYWHIDHIIPKSWFIYTKPEDIGFKMCWDLDNLQPLEANKNLTKNNRYAG